MKIQNIIIVVSVLFITNSCVEKYWPKVDEYNNVLVVDGLLTNIKEQTKVSLSYSSSVNQGQLSPLSNGNVYITDDNQVEFSFIESEPGVYIPADKSFKGVEGASYQLFVELQGGSSYMSEICTLLEPAPIDSLFWIKETREIPNRYLPQNGIQFYLNNHANEADTNYYLWRLSNTYEYQSSFDIDYTWEGDFYPYPVPDTFRTCWRTSQIQQIFTYTTKFLQKPIINKFPLVYVSTDGKELSIRYSLLVSQLTISDAAYYFWDILRQQNTNLSNLYAQQPFQIKGNVKNINDSEEVVLGYFTVAGATNKRIYLDRPALPFNYPICEPDYTSMRWIKYEPPSTWPIYLTQDPNTGAIGMGSLESCFDCRLEGGSLEPPDFWED